MPISTDPDIVSQGPPKKPKPPKAPATPATGGDVYDQLASGGVAVGTDRAPVADVLEQLAASGLAVGSTFKTPTPQEAADVLGMAAGALTTDESLFGKDPTKPEAPAELTWKPFSEYSQAELDAMDTGERLRARRPATDTEWNQWVAANVEQPKTPEEQAVIDATVERKRQTQRADVLGYDLETNDLKEAAPKIEALTWDEYNALSSLDRAAVDFNTMLTQAVAKDLKRQDKYDEKMTDKESATYDQRTAEMFGEDRGSDLRAPETVALLRQLAIPTDEVDLDEFLNLSVAITSKDLKAMAALDSAPAFDIFGGEVRVPSPELADKVNIPRTDIKQGYAEATLGLETELAHSQQLLQSMTAGAREARLGDLRGLGGIGIDQKRTAGYGTDELDNEFRGALQMLSTKPTAEAKALAAQQLGFEPSDKDYFQWALSETGKHFGPEKYTKLLHSLDTFTGQSASFDLPLGEGDGYRSPEEFRALLGLDKRRSKPDA